MSLGAKDESQPQTFGGYLSPAYARSFSEFGVPVVLPRSGGSLLIRSIPGSDRRDAMGCYPFLCCSEWTELEGDLDVFGQGLVSLVAVTDPLALVSKEHLQSCFPAGVSQFKTHFTIDLSLDPQEFVSPHHRRNSRRALTVVDVSWCEPASEWTEDWAALYDSLIERHDLRGLHRFSTDAFRAQLAAPGIRLLRAELGGEVVAMTMWALHADAAYYHLGASSPRGYDAAASFALFQTAIEEFSSLGLDTVCLGGGAGATSAERTDGLARFKRGWATGTATAYLCRRVFDHELYQRLTSSANVNPTSYFPAYRDGEFT